MRETKDKVIQGLRDENARLRAQLDAVEYFRALTGPDADPKLAGLLKFLFDSAPFPMTLTDPATGELIFANRTAYAFYGISTAEEFSGLDVRDYYVNVADREAIIASLRAKGEVTDTVIPMRLRSGEVRWMSFHARVLKIGDRPAIMSAQVDVTDRVRSERRLSESEEKFFKAFMNAPISMAITSVATKKLIDVNLQFEKLTGYARDELIGRTTVELGLLTEEERTPAEKDILRNRSVTGYEFLLHTRDGRERQMLFNGELITLNEEKCLLTIAQDVTDIRLAELEAIKAQRLEALGVLAGGIAHDFNNLLTGILGNITLSRELIDDPQSEAAQRLVECEKACRRAGELSHQLLTFSKGGEPHKHLINLGRFLEEVATFSLRGSNVSATVECPPELDLVEGDEGQLGQVMHNLLINAAQAMPNGGVVRVEAQNVELAPSNEHSLQPGRYVRLKVVDAGCGIPARNIDRVFDPYFTTKVQGTGLGLSTVYSIVRRHEGAVWVTSREGRGAAFTTLLPSTSHQAKVKPVVGKVAHSGGGGRVLIMDDEKMILDVAKAIVRHLGYQPTTALDGAEAVVYAKEAFKKGEPFDVALLDLTVPGGMGGEDAARLLADLSPSTLLVVSSGYNDNPLIARYAEHGFAGAIPKPYTVENVGVELKRVMALKKPVSADG